MVLYFHRKAILDSVRRAAPNLVGTLLDVGCGNKPYASLLPCAKHVGVDVATSVHGRHNFDHCFDGETLPFKDAQFDSILCTEVLEHACHPQQLAKEIGRVLRPGGYALITAPFVLYHHETPHDYQRFTRFGMEQLANEAGLDVVWIEPRWGVFATMAQSVYVAASQLVSRRPISDLMWWGLFPFAVSARLLDKWRARPEIISLGWQLLGVRRADK